MNPDQFIIDLIIFAFGVLIGVGTVAFMVGRREHETMVSSTADQDTETVNWLEFSECNLFFNTEVDGGSWGLLGGKNELLAVGKSIRQAVASARMKETAEAANGVYTPAEAS